MKYIPNGRDTTFEPDSRAVSWLSRASGHARIQQVADRGARVGTKPSATQVCTSLQRKAGQTLAFEEVRQDRIMGIPSIVFELRAPNPFKVRTNSRHR